MGPRVKESGKASNHEHRLRFRLRVRKLPLGDIENLNMDQVLSRVLNNVPLVIKRRQQLRPRIQWVQGNMDHFIKRTSPEFQNKIDQLMRVQKEASDKIEKIIGDEKVTAAKEDVVEELVKKMELVFTEPEEKLVVEMHKMSLH